MAEPRPAVRVVRIVPATIAVAPPQPPLPPPAQPVEAVLLAPESDDRIQIWDRPDTAPPLPEEAGPLPPIEPIQPFVAPTPDPIPPFVPAAPAPLDPGLPAEEKRHQEELRRQNELYQLREYYSTKRQEQQTEIDEKHQAHHKAEEERQRKQEEQRELQWSVNVARIHADLTYQFVILVAGAMGQATTPESYWEGMGAGSAAVDRAFENLMTEREEHLPMLAPPGAATVLAESLRNRPIVVDDVAEQRKLLSQLNPLPDSGKDPLAEVQDLTEYATALKKLLEESGLPKDSIKDLEVTKNFANRLRGIIAPGVPVGSVVDTMDADALRRVWNGLPAIRTAALMPPIAPAAQADFLRLENLADLDGMRKLVKDHTPAPSSPVTPAVPTTGSVPASSPAVATSDDYGQSIRVDGKIVNRVENGQLTLLRLMFRPNGFSPQQFRAWDLLYNEGRITAMELENKKPRAAGDGRGGSYDPTNPLHLEKALQAQRRILQMLQQGKASAQWRRAPENTGIVFLTPKFQFALQMAFSRVKLVAGCQHVPLIDLMTHQEVRTYYAYLVALEMAGASNTLNPTRYSRVSQQPDIEGQRSMLLRVFQQCGYDSLTGTLVFQNLDNSGARLMRQHVERHRQEQYAATGTLETQGSLPLLTLQPFKKPRHAIDPRPEYLLQMRAGMATGRRH